MWQTNCDNGIAEIERKKNCETLIGQCHCWNREIKKNFSNCDNDIAENGKLKKKKLRNLWKSKKKLSRPQYFYNIFTINHTWLVIIS